MLPPREDKRNDTERSVKNVMRGFSGERKVYIVISNAHNDANGYGRSSRSEEVRAIPKNNLNGIRSIWVLSEKGHSNG